eukprot:g670.t1
MATFASTFKEGDLVDGHDPEQPRYARAKAQYKPRHQRFVVKADGFDRQYSHLYVKRFQTLSRYINDRAKERWLNDDLSKEHGKTEFMPRIIGPAKTEKCLYCFVGTIYKQMEKKPCILDEIDPDPTFRVTVPLGANYADESDSLVLEDATGRVVLSGKTLPIGDLVTGVMCAVRGTLGLEGTLNVLPGAQGICFAGLRIPPPMPPLEPRRGKYVLLLSGLGIGANHSSPLFAQMLIDFVSGHLGDAKLASQIVRVIVAGDSLGKCHTTQILKDTKSKKNSSKVVAEIPESIKRAEISPLKDTDAIIAELASSVAVDLMPGVR